MGGGDARSPWVLLHADAASPSFSSRCPKLVPKPPARAPRGAPVLPCPAGAPQKRAGGWQVMPSHPLLSQQHFAALTSHPLPKMGKKKKGPSQGLPPAPEDGLPDPEGNTQNLAGAQKAKKPQITGISAGAQPALAAAQLSSPPGRPPAVGSCRGRHPLCATQTELGPPHKCWGTLKPPRVFFLPALLQGKREAGLGRAVLTTEARAPFLWDRAPMCRGYKYQRARGTSEADPL